MPEAVVLPLPNAIDVGVPSMKEAQVPSAEKKMPNQTHVQIPKKANFAMGGLAGMGATCVVQPLDLVKTRMQLAGEGAKGVQRNTMATLLGVIRSEGFFALYRGLSAALLRQATYTTTRLGVYTSLSDMYTSSSGAPPNLIMKIGMGMTAGAIGATVGTPAEISLVRMTADGRLPVDQRRGYKNVFNALTRITREEGVMTLWRGCGPTVIRAMVVNAAQLASYSQAKQMLLATSHFQDNIKCHFTASMISGLITTLASMPADIAKTRIQNMKIVDGKPEYRGTMDVLLRIARGEGVLALWKGFNPYFIRIGSHTVITFVLLEQMRKMYTGQK